MLNYRFTALLLPVMLLAFCPALAAYPWHMPLGDGLAFPFLTILVVLFCALRYPGLLPSPLVFCSGLACDLFTRSPLGYWTLLILMALALARLTVLLQKNYGRFLGVVCTIALPVILVFQAWILASLYQFSWLAVRPSIEGMLMALLLLPFPLMLLMGLEALLIQKGQTPPSRSFGRNLH